MSGNGNIGQTLARIIATFCYVGYMRPASGTWGSAAAIPVAWVFHIIGGPFLLIAAIVIGFFKGVWATSQRIKTLGDHDPSEVVVDEAIGQWIALLPISFGAFHSGVSFWALWPGIVLAFFAFRFFDIFKLGPVKWADDREDAWGVMLDDVFAGIAAAIAVSLAGWVYHGL